MPACAAAERTILVFGDSLSAGHGLAITEAWPSLLAKRFAEKRLPYLIANASISGETTAGGRSRLPAAIERTQPAVVILALGANDGLRGLPLAPMRANLTAMIRASRAAKARVLLVGMKLPPNYGAEYVGEFERSFRQVAEDEKVPLLPFLLAPIALDANAFLPDGLHPTAAAQTRILDHVWQTLLPILR